MNGYQAAHMILQDTDWTKRCIAYPGGSRRNSERPDSAVTRAWISGRCGNNGRSASAAGQTDNSDSERKPYGYGIGKFAENHSKQADTFSTCVSDGQHRN